MTVCIIWHAYTQNSVLADGRWYKVGITASGVHKIDRSTLDALGIGEINDPSQIQIFGNAVQGILPQANAEERPIDLIENPISVVGEEDGSFDASDYILFYGLGPHKHEWSASGFEFSNNIYSDTAYYFLRLGVTSGKRIESQQSLTVTPTITTSSFDDLSLIHI